MIGLEQVTKIRRLYFAEHWTVGTIAEALGVHHSTVERAIGIERFRSEPLVRRTKLDPYKDFIREKIEKHPRLRATRVYLMIKRRGYNGGTAQLRRYIRTIRPVRSREAFMRMTTLPGEQAQVDWGSFGTLTVGRAKRKLSCFVMVLSHSRAMAARFYLDQQLPHFLQGHVETFQRFGGVPREILYDNLRSVVLEREGQLVRFHPDLLELAGHYHFAPKPCAPYRPNEKGKVERAIQYIRHSFFAAREISSVERLNQELDEWIDQVAHQRPRPRDPDRISVQSAFESEQARLLPLPEHPHSCELVKGVRSGKTPYIRFDLNDYSIPAALVREPLTLVASTTTVRLVNASGAEIARHPRCWDRGEVVQNDEHLEQLAAAKRAGNGLTGRDRLRHHCPAVDRLLQEVADRNHPLRPQTAMLNQLLDRYGPERLKQAVEEVLQRGAASAASVAHVLDRMSIDKGEPPPLQPVSHQDPRVRDLRVRLHDLRSYDQLAATRPEEQDDG